MIALYHVLKKEALHKQTKIVQFRPCSSEFARNLLLTFGGKESNCFYIMRQKVLNTTIYCIIKKKQSTTFSNKIGK